MKHDCMSFLISEILPWTNCQMDRASYKDATKGAENAGMDLRLREQTSRCSVVNYNNNNNNNNFSITFIGTSQQCVYAYLCGCVRVCVWERETHVALWHPRTGPGFFSNLTKYIYVVENAITNRLPYRMKLYYAYSREKNGMQKLIYTDSNSWNFIEIVGFSQFWRRERHFRFAQKCF